MGKFKVIIEEGNPEEGISRKVVDCDGLEDAIRVYREAMNSHSQSQLTLCRDIAELQ